MTYGFMSLEVEAIELDDPFGDDPNDFDNSAMAMTAFEDTYLTIRDIDGPDWVDTLRTRMFDKNDTERLTMEQSWLLATVV
jgi:predicted membrane chloride channel (bestrophin family)